MGKQRLTDRITIDLDDTELHHALMRALEAHFSHDAFQTSGYRSASGKGFHIIVQLRKGITFPQQFEYRRRLGDCPARLWLSKKDYERGFNPDVLFTNKKINGKWKTAELIFAIGELPSNKNTGADANAKRTTEKRSRTKARV